MYHGASSMLNARTKINGVRGDREVSSADGDLPHSYVIFTNGELLLYYDIVCYCLNS